MSITYERLSKKPLTFQKLTGTSIKDFEAICGKVAPLWNQLQDSKKLDGRPSKITGLRNQLLAMLMYYRTYVTYEFLGFLFGLDQSNVWRAVNKLEPLVIKVISIKKDRTLTSEELSTLIIDATEQAINRPTKGQKQYYSGKKKTIQSKQKLELMTKGK